MTIPGNATAERQRLASELRRLREKAGLTIQEVGEALECSDSKISRIETGRVGATRRDVKDILDLYQVGAEQRQELLQLARGPRQTGWWRAYGDVPSVPTYVDYEMAAAGIDSCQALVIPGLLQTREYARTVIPAARPDLTAEQAERRLALRMERQEKLFGKRPPRLRAVLDEAVLHRQVGGAATLRQQLDHLVDIVERRDVTLHVLRFKVGAHAGVQGPFSIFSFAEPTTPRIVYVEHPAGDYYLRREEDTLPHVQAFDLMLGLALSPDASRAFIAEIADTLR